MAGRQGPPAGGIGKGQVHGQVGGDDSIVHHRHRHRFKNFARREDSRLAATLLVIHAWHGRAIVAVAKLNRDVARTVRIRPAGAAGAANGNERLSAIFINLIIGRSEFKRAGTGHGPAINPGNMRGRLIIILREAAANDQHLIRSG